MMERINPEIDEVVSDLKDYVTTSLDLYKLKSTEKGAEIASSAIIHIVLALFAVLTLLFASVALAYGLAGLVGKTSLGFLIVAGIYALFGVIVLLTKDKWMKPALIDNIIKSMYGN